MGDGDYLSFLRGEHAQGASPMEDFARFVFTASANAEPPAADPVPPPPTGGAAGRTDRRPRRVLSFERLAKHGPIAAAVLVVAVLGGAALWERLPKARRPAYDRSAFRYTATGSGPVLPRHLSGGPDEAAPVPPPRPALFASSDDLPDYGGAEAPAAGDDVDLSLIEDRLRVRLRAEGKLPPEAGSMEDLRRRVESAKDTLIRFASQRGG